MTVLTNFFDLILGLYFAADPFGENRGEIAAAVGKNGRERLPAMGDDPFPRAYWQVMIRRISRSVSRMPSWPSAPTFEIVCSTSLPTMPSPPQKPTPCIAM